MNTNARIDLTRDEELQLAAILKVKPTEMDAAFASYAAAAVEEYVRMFLGQRSLTRGSDIREYRLFLLIRYVEKSIPDEQKVCALFQCTLSQSRALLRAVMSKYQYDLRDTIKGTLIDTLKRAETNTDRDAKVTVNNENIIEGFNKVLASLNGALPPCTKKADTISTYELRSSSYLALCKEFKIEPRKP